MLLFDAHLDLSMNALEWNRDLTRPLDEMRRREYGKTDKVDRGKGVVTLPEMRRGQIGVGPLRSVGAAEFMRTKVPGVYIPDAVIERLKSAPKNKQRAEGKKICVEIIQQVREIAGVAGVHIMAYRQEELVAEIVEEAGLLPRPFRADAPHRVRERHLHRPGEPAR